MDYPKRIPNVGLVGGKFVDENVSTGLPGSLIPSAWGNAVTDELLAVIKAAGLAPSEDNNAQLLQAIQGLAASDIKRAVRVATTGPIALSGLQTIDGVALADGDRVLVKNQANAAQNWIYTASANAWARSLDANENAECTPGHLIIVQAGTAYAGTMWQLTNTLPPQVGTTPLTFAILYGKTGVAAGDYRKVSVDALGRVTAGANPTTLAGYGIVDAAPLDSPVLTGTPTAPTPAPLDVSQKHATTAFVYAALHGLAGVDVAGAGEFVLTDDQAGKGMIYLTGALTGDRTIILPRGVRRYTIRNATSYPFKLTVKMSIGAGVVITQGRISSVFTDNANTFLAQTDFAGAALTDTPTAPTAAVGTNTDQIATTKHLRDTLGAHGLGVSKVLKGDIDALGAPSGFYSFSAGTTGFAEYSSLIKLPYVDDRFSAQIGLVLSGAEPKLAFRTCYQPNEWGPTRYAWHDGNFNPATKSDRATTYSKLEADAAVRNTLNAYGLGATNTGSVSAANQLPTLSSGHYYYPAELSPYGAYAFVQRTTYAGNRGFEVANIPYTDRFMGRSSNADGSWRAPVELATVPALQAGVEGILAGLSINKAPNGYIKFPASMGGLILQWGNVAPVPAAGTTITFPMAFPNTVFGVYPSIITPTTDDYEIMVSNVGLQNFVLRSHAVQIPNAYWFAIGC
ncbi:gp53-like domain-containing protein [Pseudomonas carassii]|uniref:Putative tail fiber protein gp53-like C-terminal domain-containing protein n=1 Tax=Pseudomonas carassii TaxID=3115855 RepID=A0ABU7HC72_9PSED|nr:hypothetical protein [Pseudomonas sp. 137P]MEE1888869.1 hypothetical protein [Pseudomonas sp. 137P]